MKTQTFKCKILKLLTLCKFLNIINKTFFKIKPSRYTSVKIEIYVDSLKFIFKNITVADAFAVKPFSKSILPSIVQQRMKII